MRILGIDPGYAIVGYGAIEYEGNQFTTLAYGAVTTQAGVPFERRIEQVYDGVCQVIDCYKPEAISIEQLFFTTNQKTAIMVAQARGVVLLAAMKRGIPIFEYTPLQVKQSVVGYGKAVKHQVMEMTRILLHLKEVPKPDDAADALAIAICHAHAAGSSINKNMILQAVGKKPLYDSKGGNLTDGQRNLLRAIAASEETVKGKSTSKTCGGRSAKK